MAFFPTQSRIIHALASDPKIGAACVEIGKHVATVAAQIDDTAQLTVEASTLVVNGLSRDVAILSNAAPDAGQREWGSATQDALRPLGRAAQKFKG